jgi:hypothetical protein
MQEHFQDAMPRCIDHGERLAVAETQMSQMSEDMKALAASVKELIRFQTTIVAQLRLGAALFAVVQPIVTGMVLYYLPR